MGMDVYGKRPADETGRYFRNNVWWWHPLADYCMTVAPDIAEQCQCWHSNDGAGLNGNAAVALANALQAEIDSGRCAAYAAIREAELTALPSEPCDLCDGTGKRKPAPARGAGGVICNNCDGTGSVRPWETRYPFAVENVREFVAFLRECGGFEIC
jgi:hypothetical protein